MADSEPQEACPRCGAAMRWQELDSPRQDFHSRRKVCTQCPYEGEPDIFEGQ